MKIDPTHVVDIDLTTDETPRTIKVLRPVVFLEGEEFGCLLGPDKDRGIYGSGKSAEAALADWNMNLASRIENPAEDDEVAQFAIDSLSITKNDVW